MKHKTGGWLLSAFLLLLLGLVAQAFFSPLSNNFPSQPFTKKMLTAEKQGEKSLPDNSDNIQHNQGSNKRVASQSHGVSYLDIELSPDVLKVYRKIQTAGAEEKTWQNITFKSEGMVERVNGKLKLHGWTSLATPQKSYSIKLREPFAIDKGQPITRFFLINMIHDDGKFQGWFSYSLLAKLGLFPNYFQYIVVNINGKHQGLYLLIERTKDALLRTEPLLEFMARRRTDTLFTNRFLRSEETKEDDLSEFIKVGHSQNREQKRETYYNLLDIKNYMAWLTYNALVGYPDCLDEIFLYQTKSTNGTLSKLKITAWDYDQLFHPPARPEKVVTSQLFSGVESSLGHFIASDPQMLAMYKKEMEGLLLTHFTEEKLLEKLGEVHIAQRKISRYLTPAEGTLFLSKADDAIVAFQHKLLTQRKTLLDIVTNR